MNRRTFMTTLFAGVVTPGLLRARKPQANVEALIPKGTTLYPTSGGIMAVTPRTAGMAVAMLLEQGKKFSALDKPRRYRRSKPLKFRPAAGSPEKTQRK